MFVSVSFYSYQGKPNVAEKTFAQSDLVATKQVNLITNSRPELSMQFEFDESIAANYCVFTVDGLSQRWFIDSITAFENMYTYNCSLDVLSTYWNSIKEEKQLIERSSTLTPSCNMPDTLWKTGKKLGFNVYYSSSNPFTLEVDQDEDDDSFVYYLGTVHWETEHTDRPEEIRASSRMDVVNNYGTDGYLLSPLQLKIAFAGFFDDSILNGLSKISRDDPLSGIASLHLYPFNIETHIRGNTLTDKNRSILVGNSSLSYDPASGAFDCKGFRVNSSTAVLDCGHIDLPSAYGDYRDYEPFSSYKLFLPFVGYTDLPINDFRNSGHIYIKYFVDLFTGEAIVALYPSSASNNSDEEKRPRITIPCKLGFEVPLASTDAATRKANVALRAAATGAMVASTFSLGFTPATMALAGASNAIPMIGNGMGSQLPTPANMPVQSVNPATIGTTTRQFTGSPQSVYFDGGGRWGSMRRGMAISSFMNAFGQAGALHTLNGSSFSPMRNFSLKPFLMVYTPQIASISDTEQNAIYGRLVMVWNKLNESGGFIKVTDCNLPMSGMRVDVYNKMVQILEEGFYKS